MNIDKTERLYPHFKDRTLFLKAAKFASEVAFNEGLELRTFVPKFRLSRGCATGLCNYNEKKISIVIRHRTDKQDGGEWEKEPLPWDYIEYVTLHEVGHLKHPNHSKEFRQYERYLCETYGSTTKYLK